MITKSTPYYGHWGSWTDVVDEFCLPKETEEPTKVYCADYRQEGYEGYAFVLFRRGRKYYTVMGSHCSCYGLEGQWRPEEYATKALLVACVRKQPTNYDYMGHDVLQLLGVSTEKETDQ